MKDALPLTASQRWDVVAEKVRKGDGQWIVVLSDVARPRNDKVRGALERRGLSVEVTSRSVEGRWRTWARTV